VNLFVGEHSDQSTCGLQLEIVAAHTAIGAAARWCWREGEPRTVSSSDGPPLPSWCWSPRQPDRS